MTFGCEVQTLYDNGYGKLRHNKKLGESAIRAVDSRDSELVVKPDPANVFTATPGKEASFVCISRGADPPPKLSFMIQGRNLSEMYGGSVIEAHVGGGSKSDYAIQVNNNIIVLLYEANIFLIYFLSIRVALEK